MSNTNERPDESGRVDFVSEGEAGFAKPLIERDVAVAQTATLELLEETLAVSKQDVLAGTVRVSTKTETHEEIAEVTLDRNVIDVTRVPVGQIVDVAPAVRTEGDTTIVPVIEERFVVVKQLFLREELHIRHHVETEVSRTPVSLRKQTAVLERIDRDGRVIAEAAVPRP